MPPRLVLVIVCAGVVLASLDLFIVNVALPSIGRDLHTQPGRPLVGAERLRDRLRVAARPVRPPGREPRRENGFLLGALIFTPASAACGAATTSAMLIVFRMIQAAGAALLTPTSLSLVLATTAPEKRHGAVRAWTAVGGPAAALGPVVGGLLVAASWRWVFFVNVPIGLRRADRRLAAAAPRRGPPGPPPDALGAMLVTAGVALLTLGLVKGNDWGWGSAPTFACARRGGRAAGRLRAALLRHHNPLIDPRLFKVRAVHRRVDGGADFSIAFGAMLLSIVLWMQDVWGWSALQTGLAFAPGPLMVPLFAFADHRPPDRALRSRAGDRRRRDDLRGRPRLVGAAGRVSPGLRRRDARRHAADRHRRRADAADVHGDGRLRAAPESFATGSAVSTCSARWASRSASRCSSPCSARRGRHTRR